MMSSVAPTAAPSVPAEADLTTPSTSIAATTARERVAGIFARREPDKT